MHANSYSEIILHFVTGFMHQTSVQLKNTLTARFLLKCFQAVTRHVKYRSNLKGFVQP